MKTLIKKKKNTLTISKNIFDERNLINKGEQLVQENN